jgi:hypothetical protein
VASTVGSNLAVALELFDLALAMQAERFRREDPNATDAEIDGRLQEWLLDRPGAPFGDSAGRPVPFPRTS